MISDSVIAQIGSLELYVDVTLLVALAGAVWTLARRLTQELYFRLSIRTREIEVSFEAHPNVPEQLKTLNLLFIRYGNDTYLRDLASDQEKYHGRLRNKVTRINIDRDTVGKKPIVVKIKVHKRLGTQFKFFVDVEGDAAVVEAYLKSHDGLCDVSCNRRPMRRANDIERSRIFFLIKELDVVKTVDDFENNFIFPV